MSAIGCHAQHLACFVAGRAIARVSSDMGALMPGRKVVDYASALIELEGGARGTFTATQAAAGAENDIRLRVYGEKGMLDWSHREASYLKFALIGEPVRVIGRGDPFSRRRSSRSGARRADTRKGCAKRSRTSMESSHRSALPDRSACNLLPRRIRASRTRSRWPSSRRASRRSVAAAGSTLRGTSRRERACRRARDRCAHRAGLAGGADQIESLRNTSGSRITAFCLPGGST